MPARSMLGATAGGEVGAAEARADLVQRAGDVGGGHPVGLLLAVDAQLERAAEADGDAAAVGDRLVEAGGDEVVVADLDALGSRTSPTVSPSGDLLAWPSRDRVTVLLSAA